MPIFLDLKNRININLQDNYDATALTYAIDKNNIFISLKLRKDQTNSTYNNVECPICLEAITKQNCVSLQDCSHSFCETCIKSLLESILPRRCPTCRASFNLSDLRNCNKFFEEKKPPKEVESKQGEAKEDGREKYLRRYKKKSVKRKSRKRLVKKSVKRKSRKRLVKKSKKRRSRRRLVKRSIKKSRKRYQSKITI